MSLREAEGTIRGFLNLDEDTNYQLKIVLGATSDYKDDTSVLESEALEISFKTLETLLEPTENEII
ncbi:MAG: hypothetical protein ACNYNY_03360 [Candidatus Oxydemutatoraceae bacterium WSBS_2016_MAG_OTU14]